MHNSLLPAAGVKRKLPPSGLQHWWKLKDDLQDSVGSLHGSIVGNATLETVDGKKALRYLGAGYLSLPTQTLGAGPFSFNMFYRAETLAKIAALFTDPSTTRFFVGITANAGGNARKPYLNAATMNPVQSVYASQAVVLQKWTMFTFTFTGTVFKMYMDAVLVGTWNLALNIPSTVFQAGFFASGSNYATGAEHDIMQFNRELTQAEITSILANFG